MVVVTRYEDQFMKLFQLSFSY